MVEEEVKMPAELAFPQIKSVNILKGKENLTQGHTNSVETVAVHPTKPNTIASGSHDHTIKLWDINSGKNLNKFEGHAHGVWSIAFHPSGNVIASGSPDSTVRTWDAKSGKKINLLKGFERRVIIFHLDLLCALLQERSLFNCEWVRSQSLLI